MPKNAVWFASNILDINVNKSIAMLFYPLHRIINTDNNMIKIIITAFPFSISTYFLGIYIDNNLTWNAHRVNKYKTFQRSRCCFLSLK